MKHQGWLILKHWSDQAE